MKTPDTKKCDFDGVDLAKEEIIIRLRSALAVLRRKTEERKQKGQQQRETTKDDGEQFRA
jgi:hypothetical protein